MTPDTPDAEPTSEPKRGPTTGARLAALEESMARVLELLERPPTAELEVAADPLANAMAAAQEATLAAGAAVTAGRARLRAEFPAAHVGKLPKARFKGSAKGLCSPDNPATRDRSGAPQDHYCGGWHGLPAVHLDYVGHGAVTDRLLEVDPEWEWEPVAGWAPDGSPVFVRDNQGRPTQLWIRLTVLGVTRAGVGTVEAGHPEAEKILIGDALRNAAMRFGVALDLWIKGHAEDDEKAGEEAPPAPDAEPEGRTHGTGTPPASSSSSDTEVLEGWESARQQEGATGALVRRLERLDPAQARTFKEWRRAAGLNIPAPKADHERMVAAAANIARGMAPDGHEAAQDAPGAPNGPAGDGEEPRGALEGSQEPAEAAESSVCPACKADPCECAPELEEGPARIAEAAGDPDPGYGPGEEPY